MIREPKHPARLVLTIIFAMVVFVILFITMTIVGCAFFLLDQSSLGGRYSPANLFIPLIAFAIASIVIGTLVATFLSRIPLKPINIIINGLNSLASGNYKKRIYLGHLSIAQEMSNSFNTLASELENTEMLRSDFVNNFSHEFKTPIVSISGFAKLLQKGTLSPNQQKEYLDIIVEESERLSVMATNVLNLTKVENQSILTEVSYFNLSEQLRKCVLMLENKWLSKELIISAAFNEHNIHANEELLKQVWINILDNAIKFSPRGGEIELVIGELEHSLTVVIKNHGPKMSAEEIRRVFDKFWQGDTSHAAEGTGIGLSIAKRVVELHKGNISIMSSEAETSFIITIPK